MCFFYFLMCESFGCMDRKAERTSKISLFQRWTKVLWVWNGIRVNKSCRYSHFCVILLFKWMSALHIQIAWVVCCNTAEFFSRSIWWWGKFSNLTSRLSQQQQQQRETWVCMSFFISTSTLCLIHLLMKMVKSCPNAVWFSSNHFFFHIFWIQCI